MSFRITPAERMTVERLYVDLCRVGLRLPVDVVPPEIARKQKNELWRLTKSVLPEHIASAMHHGMSRLWPYTDGRPWNAFDLSKNILKAMGEAEKQRRRGDVPFNAQQLLKEDSE